MALRLCEVLPPTVAVATERATQMGALRNSILRGGGNVVGFAAELAFVEVLKAAMALPATVADKYNYDVLAGLSGVKLELKTKTTTVVPKKYYDNSVCNANAKQAADYYVFLRLRWDLDGPEKGGTLYFCGFEACATYKARARALKKGEKDGDNGYICRSDCWNRRIEDCGTWADLITALRVPAGTSEASATADGGGPPSKKPRT
jgi:hypothetical protein